MHKEIQALTGFSRHTLALARAVVEAAEQVPGRYSGVVKEMDSSGNVARAYRKIRNITFESMKATAEFAGIVIGRKPLAEFTAQEVHWLVGFFGELGKVVNKAPRQGRFAGQMFSAAQLRRATTEGDRVRDVLASCRQRR